MNGQCDYEYDGKDTDGTKWYKCKTHDELAPSQYAPCAGYKEIPYNGQPLLVFDTQKAVSGTMERVSTELELLNVVGSVEY